MNDKSTVSKELNAKHRKILEGLLKLPENRECADCKCKGPRWASVNLGIFVCMQCSGIHRSLGVHISKVRSTTLDTWLPEQVAFIQSMGNEKANSYWEAELPPNYDRVGIENFIRAKYEEKRWVLKDGEPKAPSRRLEETAEVQRQTPNDRTGHGKVSSSGNFFDAGNTVPATSTRGNGSVKIILTLPPKGPEQVSPAPVTEQMIQKTGLTVPADSSKEAPGMVSPPKVDFATDLFDMLTVDGSGGNTTGGESGDDDTWAGFQAASASSSTEKNQIITPAKLDENKTSSTSGIEDLFKNSVSSRATNASSLKEKNQTTTTPAILAENKIHSASGIEHLFKDAASSTPISMSEKPKKDLKDDIMSLFEKSNIVSPFAVHQQQLAMLAQQQSLLMAAASTASGGTPTVPGNTQVGLNGINLPNQGWTNVGHQFPGMMLPATGKVELEKYMQMGYVGTMHTVESSFHMPSTSDVGIINGSSNGSAASASGKQITSSQSPGNEYDFSSLTQGLFSKN